MAKLRSAIVGGIATPEPGHHEEGFSHLGRFSVAYRNHFHEPPRTTLSKCRVNAKQNH